MGKLESNDRKDAIAAEAQAILKKNETMQLMVREGMQSAVFASKEQELGVLPGTLTSFEDLGKKVEAELRPSYMDKPVPLTYESLGKLQQDAIAAMTKAEGALEAITRTSEMFKHSDTGAGFSPEKLLKELKQPSMYEAGEANKFINTPEEVTSKVRDALSTHSMELNAGLAIRNKGLHGPHNAEARNTIEKDIHEAMSANKDVIIDAIKKWYVFVTGYRTLKAEVIKLQRPEVVKAAAELKQAVMDAADVDGKLSADARKALEAMPPIPERRPKSLDFMSPALFQALRLVGALQNQKGGAGLTDAFVTEQDLKRALESVIREAKVNSEKKLEHLSMEDRLTFSNALGGVKETKEQQLFPEAANNTARIQQNTGFLRGLIAKILPTRSQPPSSKTTNGGTNGTI